MIRHSVVMVTGGGAGLGLALVDRLVSEGAKVAVLDRSKQRLQSISDRFARDEVITIHGDVTNLDANFEAVERTVAAFGRLDTLVANAALWDFSTSLLDLPRESIAEAFDEVFGVNVKGYLFAARAAAPALLESRGSIVFSLSNSALYAGGGGPLYTASKHAGVGLVKQLAHELAPKVRVNAVAPTAMATELVGPRSLRLDQQTFAQGWDGSKFATRVPMGFVPTAQHYLGAYLYLMDRDMSATVTGTISVCDMGLGVRGIRSVAGGAES